MITVAEVADFLESFAPLRNAAEWDNVGLLLGSRDAAVERVLTCLTLTPEVAAEAVAWPAQLIITHHPVLFRPVKRITDDTSEGRMILTLLRAGVAVYSPHTAFDDCPGGINDMLAAKLQLQNVRPLRPGTLPRRCKLVVFVPENDLGKVSDAIFAAGAGIIGEYSRCSFRLAGAGTFFGGESANPTVGQKGRQEEVAEWRLEAVCNECDVAQIVAAMRRAHSYEEPAYDVYPLLPQPAPNGSGRIGELAAPCRLTDLVRHAGSVLSARSPQFVGNSENQVQCIAIACGSGASFLDDAVRLKADVLLTGEARFHDCLAAKAAGISLILAGHFATERFALESLAGRMRNKWPKVQIEASRSETDPIQHI